MADPKDKDCVRIHELIAQINSTVRELAQLRRDMDELGFGTARTLRLMQKVYAFAVLLDKLVPGIWSALYDYVRCKDETLAQLAVNELKILVQVLKAHAETQLEAIDNDDRRQDLERWLDKLTAELNNWADDQGKDAAIAIVKALKQYVKQAAPWILEALVDAFADDVAEAVLNGLTSRKTLIKTITKRIVIFALGKSAASKVNPFVSVALTGWELLVEVAGSGAADELQAYIDKLLVELVVRMKNCGWMWPQHPRADGFLGVLIGAQQGNKYRGANVTVRAYLRCAKIVDGRPQWSTPCALKFENGRPAKAATVSMRLTDDKITNGRWEISAPIVPATVQNAPCLQDARYCYTYLEITIVLADGTRTVLSLICGVQTF